MANFGIAAGVDDDIAQREMRDVALEVSPQLTSLGAVSAVLLPKTPWNTRSRTPPSKPHPSRSDGLHKRPVLIALFTAKYFPFDLSSKEHGRLAGTAIHSGYAV